MTNMIKILRMRKGMTQEELSAKLGVTKFSVQKYENGGIVNLKAHTIRTLCELFEVPPAFFIYEYDELQQMDVELMFSPLFNRKWTQDIFYKRVVIKTSGLNALGIKRLNDYIDDLLKITEYKDDEK